MLLSFSLSL